MLRAKRLFVVEAAHNSESRTGAEWAVSVLQREARLSSGSRVIARQTRVSVGPRGSAKGRGPHVVVEHYD